jgi:hypothetical protein
MSSSSPSPFTEYRFSVNEEPIGQTVIVPNRKENIRKVFVGHWHTLKFELRELITFHPREWRNAFRRNPKYPLFVKGDIDALVALFIDNMATLLTIILSLQTVLDSDIVYGKIVPG